jgi:hypothetical protein
MLVSINDDRRVTGWHQLWRPLLLAFGPLPPLRAGRQRDIDSRGYQLWRLLTRRAHNALGTATQCTRINDSPPPPPPHAARRCLRPQLAVAAAARLLLIWEGLPPPPSVTRLS